MTRPRLPLRRLMTGVILAVATGCASAPEEDAETSPESAASSIQDVRREIELAIGEAQATNAGQCALVALGERPCGGPRFYRAYSTLETDSASLDSLVALYDRLDRERNLEQGLVSTCEVLPRPTVRLEGGRCVVVQ